jgi:hypothetical protein
MEEQVTVNNIKKNYMGYKELLMAYESKLLHKMVNNNAHQKNWVTQKQSTATTTGPSVALACIQLIQVKNRLDEL